LSPANSPAASPRNPSQIQPFGVVYVLDEPSAGFIRPTPGPAARTDAPRRRQFAFVVEHELDVAACGLAHRCRSRRWGALEGETFTADPAGRLSLTWRNPKRGVTWFRRGAVKPPRNPRAWLKSGLPVNNHNLDVDIPLGVFA
jgi:hypothetical protein